MKKFVLIAAMLLSACASQQNQAFIEKQQSVNAATNQDGAAVAAGTMKPSVYYTRFYERLSQPPISPADYAAMQGASKMIDVSKAYEAGRISKDDFDTARRQVMLDFQGAAQQAQAQAAAQAAAQDEARRAAAMNYLIQSRPITTNCTGTRFSSSCTTY